MADSTVAIVVFIECRSSATGRPLGSAIRQHEQGATSVAGRNITAAEA